MPTEVEARFRAETTEPLDELAARRRLGPAVLGPSRTIDEMDRYLDTDDGRLAAARWACRLRTRDGDIRISLKGPAGRSADEWMHRRPEIEGPASGTLDPDAWPPSAARDLLATLRGEQPLRERLRLNQRRTERRVTVDGPQALGTLTLDRVQMWANEVDLGALFVVELELDDASSRAETRLSALATALARVPGLVPEPLTKLEHALARLAARP
jgi:inorganic triphosphatase YgiF